MSSEIATNSGFVRLTDEIEPRVIACRRDFHRHAETGWCEFRTASLIARRLADLGYQVRLGRQVLREEDRMGLPAPDVLEVRWQRALAEGGDREFLPALRGGLTGVVGLLQNGPGPVVGLRFDLDALDLQESAGPDHRPFREGFASIHPEACHACGHDGHGAVGLGLAEVLARLKEGWRGTVKLIFQPAEEGVRGARAMVSAGVVDDVNWLLGHHLYSNWPLGDLMGGRDGYLATTKFDARFTGQPAHAGGAPQEGKNALVAAATAVLNLYAIPRHREGITRINVGRLNAGTGRNVICPQAHLAIETRGETTELNEYMYARAVRILQAAAQMHDCALEIQEMGRAQGAYSDPALAGRVERVARQIGGFALHPPERSGGSEDFTDMMRRVQQNGSQATHIGIGAGPDRDDTGGGAGSEPAHRYGHHTATFDLDERALKGAVRLLASVVADLTRPEAGSSRPASTAG